MSGALTSLDITGARDLLDAGEISSLELTEAYLKAMEAGRGLNAFITESPEAALERARTSDQRRAHGEMLGRLDGIPIAIKDLFCTEGVPDHSGLAYSGRVRADIRIDGHLQAVECGGGDAWQDQFG